MRERIVVTGINGFVGEHLARELVHEGYDVHGIGREPEPQPVISEFVTYYSQADLLEPASLENVTFKQASAIIHLAGLASVAESFEKPDLYLNGNAAMTRNLLSSAKKHGFLGRTVIVSTGALYDASQPMPLTESSLVNESSPYVAGKLRAEQVAKEFREAGDDVVIARPFNHIGPGQSKGFLVPDLFNELRRASSDGGNTILVGNLATRRDYTDVRDIVKAYIKLIAASSLDFDTYNLSSGMSLSGENIFNLLRESMGLTKIKPVIDDSRVRPTDAMDIVGSSIRIRQELGWKPLSNPKKAISDFVAREKFKS